MTAGHWVLIGWHAASLIAYAAFCVCMTRKADRIATGDDQ
ncbi:Uncharacterised protein [Ralstonia mannitolilytica]|nr:Uncharacterised protein [Ralstonia mannitolilytica]